MKLLNLKPVLVIVWLVIRPASAQRILPGNRLILSSSVLTLWTYNVIPVVSFSKLYRFLFPCHHSILGDSCKKKIFLSMLHQSTAFMWDKVFNHLSWSVHCITALVLLWVNYVILVFHEMWQVSFTLFIISLVTRARTREVSKDYV